MYKIPALATAASCAAEQRAGRRIHEQCHRDNEKIGIIKDIAATGVGIAMVAWPLVLGLEVEEMLRGLI